MDFGVGGSVHVFPTTTRKKLDLLSHREKEAEKEAKDLKKQ